MPGDIKTDRNRLQQKYKSFIINFSPRF